jgi:hypothetical protein
MSPRKALTLAERGIPGKPQPACAAQSWHLRTIRHRNANIVTVSEEACQTQRRLPTLALFGPQEMSDLSPQSAGQRTWVKPRSQTSI